MMGSSTNPWLMDVNDGQTQEWWIIITKGNLKDG